MIFCRYADIIISMDTPIELTSAIDIVTENVPQLHTEFIELNNINRHISAKAVYSTSDYPPYARSQMDGIAYNSLTAEKGRMLNMIHHLSAAEVYEGTLQANECVRVSTGSKVPDGADTVVPIESVILHGDNVQIVQDSPPWRFIERVGDRIRTGDLILPQGVMIDPWYIEALASLRINSVDVVHMPRLGILSTGSEITGLFSDTGGIVNSNYYALSSLLRRMQVEFGYLGVVPDEKPALADRLKSGLKNYDAIVTFGGTAKGRYDLMETVVSDTLGGSVLVNGVKTTPGRTFRFAIVEGTPVFILPGTPSAALICSDIFLTSWLLSYQGLNWRDMMKECTLDFKVTKKEGFHKLESCFVSPRKDGMMMAYPRGRFDGGIGRGSVNATLMLPPDVTELLPGDKAMAFTPYNLF